MTQPGTNAGSTPGFLSTVVRLCAGTDVMTEIYGSSPARAGWRFFLLTLLCAVLAAVLGTFVQKGAFERAGCALDEEIGAFVFTPETISFQKDPDTPRRLKLPYITLEYYPGDTFTSNDFNVGRTSDFGFIILPGGMASWSMVNWKGEDVFHVKPLSAAVLYAGLSDRTSANAMNDMKDLYSPGEMFSGPGFAEMLKKKFSAPKTKPADGKAAAEDTPAVLTTGSQAAQLAISMLTAVILIKTFGRNFLTIALLIILVSLVQYLRASTLPKGLEYRNVLTIMIYSTFPAQIAATLFDAAGGDRFISFQILFVCIFFVYQIFAFRAVMKKVFPQPERKDDDFDDSDF